MILSLTLIVPIADAGTEQGTTEIQVQGAFTNEINNENDDKTQTSTGQLAINYFLTDWVSIGGSGRLSGSKTDYEDSSMDDSNITISFLMFNGDLYLGGPTKAFIPYVGIRLGIANSKVESGDDDNSSSTLAYGGHIGLKIFPSESISWNLEFDVAQYTPEAEEGQDEVTRTSNSLLLGFSYYF
jgi:opacity protein-like surface antigen